MSKSMETVKAGNRVTIKGEAYIVLLAFIDQQYNTQSIIWTTVKETDYPNCEKVYGWRVFRQLEATREETDKVELVVSDLREQEDLA